MFTLTHSNGIHLPHLSPSTINSFICDKFGFWCSKVLRKPFKGNKHTVRGQAVEHAVNLYMETGNEDAEKNALDYFDAKIQETDDRDYLDSRAAIPGLAKLALHIYKQECGDRKFQTQTKVTGKLEGVERDVIGYLDFYKPGEVIRDCKVTARTPSSLSQAYIIQGSFYRLATGDKNVVFDFFIDNKKPAYKSIALTDDDYLFGISYITKAAQMLEELECCDDPKRIIEIMSFPDLGAIWNVDERTLVAKQFGIVMR